MRSVVLGRRHVVNQVSPQLRYIALHPCKPDVLIYVDFDDCNTIVPYHIARSAAGFASHGGNNAKPTTASCHNVAPESRRWSHSLRVGEINFNAGLTAPMTRRSL